MKGSLTMENKGLDLLLTRRSVRSYKPDPVPEEALDSILKAAKYAPSAMGLQKRFFTVVKDRVILQKAVAAAKENGASFIPGHMPFYNAPAVIVVSAPEDAKYNREDAACAIMNIMLAAHACGLGSCYICSVLPGLQDKRIVSELGIPQGYLPYGCVCLGYAEGKVPEAKPRREGGIFFAG